MAGLPVAPPGGAKRPQHASGKLIPITSFSKEVRAAVAGGDRL
jgi:hypothetical protein